MIVFFIPIHFAGVGCLHDIAAEMFVCHPIGRANDLGQVVAPARVVVGAGISLTLTWSLGLGAVLIEDSPLGRRVRSATWGTGRNQKFGEEISDGGAPSESFDRGRRRAPWLRGGPAQR